MAWKHEMNHDTYETILGRRSVRKFKSDPVSRELLTKLIDAARLAPSGNNEQPWEFVVVTDTARRRQFGDLAQYGRFIAQAPACIVVLCRPAKYYLEDGSAATTQLMLAAHALGLATCWVAGDKKDYAARVVELCGAPAELKLVSLIAVGYGAETPHPTKRALDEVAHWEHF